MSIHIILFPNVLAKMLFARSREWRMVLRVVIHAMVVDVRLNVRNLSIWITSAIPCRPNWLLVPIEVTSFGSRRRWRSYRLFFVTILCGIDLMRSVMVVMVLVLVLMLMECFTTHKNFIFTTNIIMLVLINAGVFDFRDC